MSDDTQEEPQAEREEGTTPPSEEEESDGLAGRWIAITLAAIVVLGAGMGILQTNASVNESNTARETTRAAVGALRANVVEGTGLQLEDGLEAEIDAFRREQSFVASEARRSGASAAPITEEEIDTAIRRAGGEIPSLQTQEALQRLIFETEFLSLTQSTLAETRVTWNDRSTQYTTAIAILAVALFLVGFSLAMKGLRRKVFWALGITVALGSFGFAVYVYSLDVPETPEAAIEEAAQGAVELANDRFERAIERYSAAIDIDDDFVSPYTDRAIATFLAANPDFRATGAVTSAEGVATDAADDLRTAVDLTDGDPDFLTLTIISLLQFYAGDFAASVSTADEAIARNGQVPDVRLLKSAAQVGLSDEAGAQETLTAALELLSGSDPSERTRALVADYVTYLEYVAFLEPDRADLAARFEREIIALETGFVLSAEPSGMAPAQGEARVEGLRFRDGRLQLTIDWRNLPADTQLSAFAFERPTADGPWVQPTEAAYFRSVGGGGQEVVNAPIERACAPTEVRVDLYLNGERVQSATGPGVAPTC